MIHPIRRTSSPQEMGSNAHGFLMHLLQTSLNSFFTAARGGNNGVVHYIETPADADWLVDVGPHKPYVALMTPHTFSRYVANSGF